MSSATHSREAAPALDSVVAAFESRVDRDPKHVAVRTNEHEVTYTALDRWANGVAASLTESSGRGSGPVPLLVLEAASMLAAELGTLKAGRPFVPIDPLFPTSRIAGLLDELQPTDVIADATGRRALGTLARGSWAGADIRAIEDLVPAAGPALRPARTVDEGETAYILYTSGSTGRPKGILQTRRDMRHNVVRHGPLGIGPDDRVTLISSGGFVGSISNPYITLLNGATVVPYSFRHDGVHGMLDWLGGTGVTVVYAFPSFLRQVTRVADAATTVDGVRLVYLGGETVAASDVDHARRMFPSAVIAVGLNSTETGLTRLFLLDPTVPTPDPVPVGGPVEGVEIQLRDTRGQTVGPGEPGEIVVLSQFVHPRLWQRDGIEELAHEARGGAFEFRTGDRGRFGAAGALVPLGRLDTMLKVRGFRIEPSEIETVALATDGVVDAVTVNWTSQGGDFELALYVEGRDSRPDEVVIRQHLGARLPACLDGPPLDRAARRPPAHCEREDRSCWAPPARTPRRPGADARYGRRGRHGRARRLDLASGPPGRAGRPGRRLLLARRDLDYCPHRGLPCARRVRRPGPARLDVRDADP